MIIPAKPAKFIVKLVYRCEKLVFAYFSVLCSRLSWLAIRFSKHLASCKVNTTQLLEKCTSDPVLVHYKQSTPLGNKTP